MQVALVGLERLAATLTDTKPMTYHRLSRVKSIRARLSLVFLFLFLLVIVLGLESLSSLGDVNDAAAQIRFRWLPCTRALGDLNNFTTDFPAADAAMLRADSDNERAQVKRQMARLDDGIAAAELAYRNIPHDAASDAIYERFEKDWRQYRLTGTKSAYETASETLGRLTERNAASARDASQRADLAYARARQRIAVTVLLAGLLVAGAMLHVTRSISAPLVDLAWRMHRLAASETSVEVLGTRRRDEIGEMARAVMVFRDNAIDLAQNRQALAQQASMLEEKLAEEQRLTRLQRNFVSMASHEFRTPLAVIDGHAQRLISMRERLNADEIAERARKVRNSVHRMTQLIDNLLGSARLIDGGIDLHFQRGCVDMAALVREVCHVQRELTPDADIVEQLEPHVLMVEGDATLLYQVVGNLLSNAVKYSSDDGTIRVSVGRSGKHVEVVVEDHGIGIPEAECQQVFERYFRGSNTAGVAGSGVGLYLVKTIVDLHKGGIEVVSRESHGSQFTLRLPARAIEAPPSAKTDVRLVS